MLDKQMKHNDMLMSLINNINDVNSLLGCVLAKIQNTCRDDDLVLKPYGMFPVIMQLTKSFVVWVVTC